MNIIYVRGAAGASDAGLPGLWPSQAGRSLLAAQTQPVCHDHDHPGDHPIQGGERRG